MEKKSKKLEIAALVVGLLLIGVGLAAWLSQHWTLDFEIGNSKTAIAKHESVKLTMVERESDFDCAPGLEYFRGECSYPCRGALMCPVGMSCNTAAGYCEGTPMTECPDYGPEVCDGVDNDCDGKIDEGCACVPGTTIACATGFSGICSMGQMNCLTDGTFSGVCLPTAFSQGEICGDGLDNDCDGRVDNGCEAYFFVRDMLAMTQDYDSDGIHDYWDNCPFEKNLDQADRDSDGMGDACDFNDDRLCSFEECNVYCSEHEHFGGLCTEGVCECVS